MVGVLVILFGLPLWVSQYNACPTFLSSPLLLDFGIAGVGIFWVSNILADNLRNDLHERGGEETIGSRKLIQLLGKSEFQKQSSGYFASFINGIVRRR